MRRILESTTTLRLMAACIMLLAAPAGALTFTFDDPGFDFEHGRIVTDQYQALGLQISAENIGGGPDYAAIFDTRLSGTRDPDMEFGPGNPYGHVLIIQENTWGCDDGVCDRPDDQGTRPAGTFTLDFDMPLRSFGLDLLDIDGPETGGHLRFFSEQGQVGPTIYFSDFIDPGSPFFLLGVVFGDHSANQIAPIAAEALGIESFDQVQVHFGGSGGIDNIRVQEHQVVPEPSTLPMAVAGLIGLAILGRRRR